MSDDMLMDYEVGDVIAIEDEGGEVREFRVMYIFEIEEKTYHVLVPTDQEEEEEWEIHFLRYEDGEHYQIEDDQEWEQVEATFEVLMSDLDKEEL